MQPLPVDEVLPALDAALAEAGACVLVAEPGAGKTTRVPPALARGEGSVWVLEPRRLAARAAARRVAAEQGWTAGQEVGWSVRFERRFRADSRVVFCTEGILLRRLQEDPFLEGIDALVLDEFHERHLEGDLVLALAQRVRTEVRPDLRIVVMSATLEAEPVAAFLGAPVVRSEGRCFPVETQYLHAEPRERLEDHVARGVREALQRTDGDVLAFLPGVGEIQRVAERLAGGGAAAPEVLPLHGTLRPEEQDRALRAGSRRRVVLATNVAESSVTVEGVRAVVDSGLARVLRHDAAVGLDRLEVARISVASADQRAGRAGRLAPGLALRLWSAIDQRSLSPAEAPEVRRLDLAGPVLQLLAFGEPDAAAFPWFEAPEAAALQRAEELLELLGAVADGRLTPLGERLARLPVHPRLGRLLLEGHALGVPRTAALTAALLAERDPFDREGPARSASADSDLDARLDALEELDLGGRAPRGLRSGPGRQVLRARDQLLRLVEREPGGHARAEDPDEALTRALLAAFPDRLAVRREPGSDRLRGVDGRGLRLARESCVTEAEVVLALVTQGTGGEPLVRQAVGVPRAWIDGGEERSSLTVVFDPGERRVRGARRRTLGPLVLGEELTGVPAELAPEAEALLAREAARAPALAFGGDPELEQLTARIACALEWEPGCGLEPLEGPFLEGLLPALVQGCRSFEDLQRRPVASLVLSSLPHGARSALERLAPERVRVPTGSQIRLRYEAGRPPVLAVRIQELFGLATTPTVAGGRVPCLLHLLAPNQRPQQVTDDLAGFWERTWPQVRKDLRARYPRHAWPEDPLAAEPQRRPRRRRR